MKEPKIFCDCFTDACIMRSCMVCPSNKKEPKGSQPDKREAIEVYRATIRTEKGYHVRENMVKVEDYNAKCEEVEVLRKSIDQAVAMTAEMIEGHKSLKEENTILREAVESKNVAHRVTYGVDCPICSEALSKIER